MKRSLMVMAVMIGCLTQSFTSSDRTDAATVNLPGANTASRTWQKTTWINPFAKSLEYVDIYCGISTDNSPSLIYLRVYVYNVLQIDWTTPTLGQVSALAGDSVRLEISTTPPDGGANTSVQDQGTTIFSQNDPANNFTTFTFVAEAGHWYSIWTRA
jgi:hypothetical protein